MSVNKSTIAKNTLLLYIRMILVMAAALYTTRIVLKNLGIEDYGIYNVVAGVVSMFGFLNSSMAGATQRFLSFELGINDDKRVNVVFCQSIIIHVLISVIILILAETLGLWFVYNKLVIPESRFGAAMWVYQFSILSFVFNVINVPYQATIIAHEKMSVYAWVSILDVVLKLGIAYLISISPYDKLIFYSFLILGTTVISFFFYMIYSKRHFIECKFRFILEKEKFLEMFSFAGWNIIGNIAYTFRVQGSNILLNMFFGPVVNAARGIANQVDGTLENFVINFQTASNPQIIKTYAQGEYDETMKLVCQCSKFSFYLMILISLPFYFQIDYILSIWLTEVPNYTTVFVKLILLIGIVDSLSKALMTQAKATGNVKWYMIIQGGFYLLVLPVIYLFLKLGYSPVSSLVILLVFTVLGTFLRIILVNNVTKGFSIEAYILGVLIPAFFTGILCFGISKLLFIVVSTNSFFDLVINSSIILSLTAIIIWCFGLRKSEKEYVKSMVLTKVLKKTK